MLPQVIVLIASGRFVGPFVERVGLAPAAWMSACTVVLGLTVFALGSRAGYGWVAVALVLVAAGMRVVGVVAGNNVLQGLPSHQTSMGAALVDTSSELASGVGIAATGAILTSFVSGSIVTTSWTPDRLVEFQNGITVAGIVLTVIAALRVSVGIPRARPQNTQATT